MHLASKLGLIARVALLAVAMNVADLPIVGNAPPAFAGMATFGTPQKQDTSSLGATPPNILALTFDNAAGLAGSSSGVSAWNTNPNASSVWTANTTPATQINAVGGSTDGGGTNGTVVHSFVAGPGGNIYYTTNNGGTWSSITNISDTRASVASFNGMSCQPGLTIFRSCTAVGTNGNIWTEFENDVVTFNKQSAPATTATLNGVSCTGSSNNTCVAVGQNATVIFGTPGTTGGSWVTTSNVTGTGDTWYGVSCVVSGTAGNTCYSVGDNGVYQSTNGGVNWSALKAGTSASLGFAPRAVAAVGGSSSSSDTVYVAGGTSGLAASNDGGATWTTYKFDSTVLTNPHALALLSGNRVYTSGDAGSIVEITVTFSSAPVPTVTGISPTSGPATGGTTVTITGTGFNTTAGGTSVSFGSAAATNVSCTSTTQCTAVSPAGSGTVQVTVSTAGGTSATSPADQFTYIGSTNSSVACSPNPVTVNTASTCTVTVTDTSPSPTTPTGTVSWTTSGGGTFSSSSCTLDGTGRCSVTYTPSSSGAQIITASYGGDTRHATSNGTTSLSVTSLAPAVSGISPSSGPSAGGTSVIITGTGFSGATAVSFGTTPATSFTVNSDTQITAICPSGTAGTSVDVTVATSAGTSATSASDRFSYGPTISNVQTTAITSSGASIIWSTDAAADSQVEYGLTNAYGSSTTLDPTLVTSHSVILSGLTPNTLYHFYVKSSTNGILSISGDFTFTTTAQNPAPAVSVISPSSGPSAGGTSVIITGTGFSGATAVSFGTTPATSFTVNSDTQITAICPSGTAGTSVDVTVATSAGTSATSASDRFTYGAWAYVANQLSNTVSVIDTASSSVVATVAVGTTPRNVAISPDSRRVFVTNNGSNSVSVIDTSTNTVIGAPVSVGGAPDALIISPDGTRVFVANTAGSSVSVIETTGFTVVATVPVGLSPSGLAISPSGTRLYVTNQGSNSLSVIDTVANNVLATIPVGTSPYGVAVKP